MDELKSEKISVCVCTYRRPDSLERMLEFLCSQIVDSAFNLEFVIVDNDKERSAENVLNAFKGSTLYEVIYDCEPEQNIALARNRSIKNANGNMIATIDDDELPDPDWLVNMYRCLKESHADGVLGPVLPRFPPGAPNWLEKSGLCERPRNVSGTPVKSRDLRTGNALFQRHIFAENEVWFNPARGLTGGSDGEFLSRQLEKGRNFVWCDDAVVYETVAEEKWRARFYLKRNFRIGALAGARNRLDRNFGAIAKSVISMVAYGFFLPFSVFFGKSAAMRVLTKILYNAGSILSAFSIIGDQYRT